MAISIIRYDSPYPRLGRSLLLVVFPPSAFTFLGNRGGWLSFYGDSMKSWSNLVWYVQAFFKFRGVDGGVWGGAALDFLFCDGVLCIRWNTATELL